MKAKRVSSEITHLLGIATLQQLEFLDAIASKHEFKDMQTLFNNMAEREKNFIFQFPEKDAQLLAVEKAFARGKAAGLATILQMIKYSQEELDRRLKIDKDSDSNTD